MRLTQYTNGQESDTQWEIPDDNVEQFLRDQLGYYFADSWEEGNVRSLRFKHKEVKPGRALASEIVVLETEGVFTATVYEYPGKSARHLRARLASLPQQTLAFIEDLKKLPDTANGYLSLYTLWGGRVTGGQSLPFQNADSALLQEARTLVKQLRSGKKLVHGTGLFDARLVRVGQSTEKSGILAWELIQDGWKLTFDLFLPGHDIFEQEAGLFGALCGSSFNPIFKASLAKMNVVDYARHSPPLDEKEAHSTAREILANRPAMITVLPLVPSHASLFTQGVQFAMHIALAFLDETT
jgi:hypothetical protein